MVHDKLSWSNPVSYGVRKYINDVGPCDSSLTRSGKTLFDSIVPEYV